MELSSRQLPIHIRSSGKMQVWASMDVLKTAQLDDTTWGRKAAEERGHQARTSDKQV